MSQRIHGDSNAKVSKTRAYGDTKRGWERAENNHKAHGLELAFNSVGLNRRLVEGLASVGTGKVEPGGDGDELEAALVACRQTTTSGQGHGWG